MAISFPITLPTNCVRSVRIQPLKASLVNMSPDTFVAQVHEQPGEAWMMSWELRAQRRDDAAVWFAGLVSLRGSVGTFYLGDTAYKTPRGVGTGTPKIAGASQTGYDIDTDGWTPSQTGVLRAGDWVQIGTSSSRQLCMVMADANSDGAGAATLTLWPGVRTAFADNTDLVVSSPKGVWRLTTEIDWSIGPDLITRGISLTAVEDII